jgi:hypothetical protein
MIRALLPGVPAMNLRLLKPFTVASLKSISRAAENSLLAVGHVQSHLTLEDELACLLIDQRDKQSNSPRRAPF